MTTLNNFPALWQLKENIGKQKHVGIPHPYPWPLLSKSTSRDFRSRDARGFLPLLQGCKIVLQTQNSIWKGRIG
jgi:hypothetical protein